MHTHTEDTDEPIAQDNKELSDENSQQVSDLQRL